MKAPDREQSPPRSRFRAPSRTARAPPRSRKLPRRPHAGSMRARRSGTHPKAPTTSEAGSTVTPAIPQTAAPPAATTRSAFRREVASVASARPPRYTIRDPAVRTRASSRGGTRRAPDQRPDDLTERGDTDDGERLETHPRGLKRKEHREHACGEHPERELPGSSNPSVEPEPTDGPDGNDGEDESRATHAYIFADRPQPVRSTRAVQSSSTKVTSKFT